MNGHRLWLAHPLTLAHGLGLPSGHIAASATAAVLSSLLCQRRIALSSHRILPRTRRYLTLGLSICSLLLIAKLASLFRQRGLRHGGALHGTIWVFDNFNRRNVTRARRSLSLQERRLVFVDLDFNFLFSFFFVG